MAFSFSGLPEGYEAVDIHDRLKEMGRTPAQGPFGINYENEPYVVQPEGANPFFFPEGKSQISGAVRRFGVKDELYIEVYRAGGDKAPETLVSEPANATTEVQALKALATRIKGFLG